MEKKLIHGHDVQRTMHVFHQQWANCQTYLEWMLRMFGFLDSQLMSWTAGTKSITLQGLTDFRDNVFLPHETALKAAFQGTISETRRTLAMEDREVMRSFVQCSAIMGAVPTMSEVRANLFTLCS